MVQTLPAPFYSGRQPHLPEHPRCSPKLKKHTYQLATWNVCMLLDMQADMPSRRPALAAAKLNRYSIDIAALSETRLADEGSLTEVGERYTFFWKGLPEAFPRIHGVGFAIRSTLLPQPETPVAVSERLMILRIPLIKGRFMTLVSAYAPTLTRLQRLYKRPFLRRPSRCS